MASKLIALSCLLLSTSLYAASGFFDPWGKDSGLSITPSMAPRTLSTPPKNRNSLSKTAESVILFHQNVISPADGPRSHFRPTSARYMLLAMRKYGVIEGYLKGCDRLLRENSDPWVYRTVVINKK